MTAIISMCGNTVFSFTHTHTHARAQCRPSVQLEWSLISVSAHCNQPGTFWKERVIIPSSLFRSFSPLSLTNTRQHTFSNPLNAHVYTHPGLVCIGHSYPTFQLFVQGCKLSHIFDIKTWEQQSPLADPLIRLLSGDTCNCQRVCSTLDYYTGFIKSRALQTKVATSETTFCIWLQSHSYIKMCKQPVQCELQLKFSPHTNEKAT